MRQRLSLLATLAVLTAFSLAGCGGSGGGDKAASTEGSPAVNATGAALEENPFPHVLISTTLGDITIKLNHEKAPLTVENFLKYVEEGFYTDTIFHEVRRDDVIIGGGYTRDLKEKPTNKPPVRNEAHNGLKNTRGTVAMVRQPDVIDSSTSQFFFNLGNNTDYLDPKPSKDKEPEQPPEKIAKMALDYGYCVFGEVVAGQEVLDEIAKQEVGEQGGVFQYLPRHLVVIKEAKRIK